MEEATRALASIAGPRRDDRKAEGQETGGKNIGLMTSQDKFMAESTAADGAQEVRGAGDAWASDVQSVQGFGSRAANGSGRQQASNKPEDWATMTQGQRRLWKRNE